MTCRKPQEQGFRHAFRRPSAASPRDFRETAATRQRKAHNSRITTEKRPPLESGSSTAQHSTAARSTAAAAAPLTVARSTETDYKLETQVRQQLDPFNMQPKTSARLRRRGKSRRGEPNKQARDNRSKKELSARAQRAAERARKREARTAAADRAEKGSTPTELSRQKQAADKQKGKGKAKRKQKQKLAPAKKKHKRATLSLMGDVATVQPRHQGRQACGRQGRQQHRDQQQHWRQMHEQQQDRRIAYALEMMHRQRRLLDNQQLQLDQIRRRLCDMQTWHCCRSSDAGNAGRSNSDTLSGRSDHGGHSWAHSPPTRSPSEGEGEASTRELRWRGGAESSEHSGSDEDEDFDPQAARMNAGESNSDSEGDSSSSSTNGGESCASPGDLEEDGDLPSDHDRSGSDSHGDENSMESGGCSSDYSSRGDDTDYRSPGDY